MKRIVWHIGRLCCKVTLALLSMLFVFDSIKRDGDILFLEISDELQVATYNTSHNVSDKNARDRLNDQKMHARVAMRRFSVYADLPGFTGRSGPFIYFASALSMAILSTLFSR